jgi:beta-glucosidase
VAAYQQVGSFEVIDEHGKLQRNGGNVASYFCTPAGRVIDAVTGPVPGQELLDEARWAVAAYDEAKAGPAGDLPAVLARAHRQAARECVRKSLALLKNSKSVLPLKKDVKRITVVGKAADDIGIQCGGWTIDWQGKPGEVTTGGTTLLAAVKKTVSRGTEVSYSRDGGDLKNPEVVIVVVGEEPYAEGVGDRQELQLAAGDAALIARAKAAGAPVLTILYSGRPLLLGAGLDHSDAFVAAWLPGTEGLGITDVLFGDAAPHGKLPRLWPANNHQFCVDHCEGKPLFPVGFGLTYGHLSKK